MMRFILKIFFAVLFVIAVIFGYFFVGKPPQAKNIIWGVNFSQKHASQLGLDWKETYLALMDDLGTKNIKLAAHWDILEPEENNFYWNDLDWQIKEARKRGVNIILIVGMKTSRWPECHIPGWAKNLPKKELQEKILNMVEKVVLRYKHSSAIKYWQAENEPFFPFGECPWADKNFLKREVELIKKLDPQKRPVIISDSGEGSFWFEAAKIGDIVGTTLYKKVWFRQIGKYITWPFNSTFYWRKARLIKWIFGKKVWVVELQAEPWGPKLLYDISLEEQHKTMNIQQFKFIIDFAKRTGLDTFYLWGSEWWYWMKTKQDKTEIWNEAKTLF